MGGRRERLGDPNGVNDALRKLLLPEFLGVDLTGRLPVRVLRRFLMKGAIDGVKQFLGLKGFWKNLKGAQAH